MIYLDNNTEKQQVWIPRNDDLGHVHTGSSQDYQEGFEDGYESGMTDQKNKLVTTAFTENGVYTREDGWSGVTVEVEAPLPVLEEKTVVISADTTNITPSQGYVGMSAVTVDASEYAQSQYDDGFDDGFNDGYASGATDGFDSGYTSGQTDQKNLLVSTAFTENGLYSRENGWSGVTVNVDTASTYNSGYTSGHTDGVEEEKAKLSATTFTANTAVTISDGGYSAVTVDVPQTGYTQQDLDDAWSSGYTSGETHQKDLLTTTALTENGNYTRTDGWSGISVNVDTGSTYNSGYTDGYDSGFTSGETHQKDLLTTTAFTENGSYSRENGWSGVTVNIDTASTWNSGYTSGYTSGHTDGVDEEKAKMSAVTFTANTAVTLSDGSYSAVTVNVPQTGGSGTSKIFFADYIHTEQLSTSNSYIVTGIYPSTATTMRIKLMSKGINTPAKVLGFAFGSSEPEYSWASDRTDYRLMFPEYYGNTTDRIYFDYNSSRLQAQVVGINADGKENDLTVGNNYIYDNLTSSYLASGTTQTEQKTSNIPIMVNVSSIWLKSLEIWQGETKVFDGKAAYDDNGHIGLYDSVSNEIKYNSGLTMAYEYVSPSYSSGYTDGQNSIISTFSSMTATTNGVYGSSANPLSSITVNVDTASTYTSGYTDGSEAEKAKLSAITFTANTAITLSDGGYSAVTVNVAQTGGTIDLNPAFVDRSIVNIVIPTGCTKVGDYAFAHCYSAVSITLTDEITSIGAEGFSVCDSVTAITFGTGLNYIGMYAFNKVGYISQIVNNNNLVLPNSVSEIGNNAFQLMPITAITFGSGTTYLNDDILSQTNVEVINCYSTTAPTLKPTITSGGTYYNTFRNMWINNGTVHYPSGSDYSSWENNQYLSGWTFVGDL